MTIVEVCDALDEGFHRVIEEYRASSGLPPATFNGVLMGFFLKTAIGLAALEGLSKDELRAVVVREIEEAFRGG